MLERLRDVLYTDCALEPGMRVVAGISGGPDSISLLDILHRLGFSIVVAHMNHQLRPEAEAEAGKVRDLARRYNLSFVEERVDVMGYAQEQGLSVEEAGRVLRYRFLFDQAARTDAQAVAVAHTADDQVETVLMHLLRGAGLSGLKGMLPRTLPNPWSQEIPLVRPLLDIWRSEVLSYCAECDLEPVFDPSNLDPAYYRNRLRIELVPYLERLHPGVKVTFWRMVKVLQADFEIIDRLVEETWEASVIDAGPGYVSLLPEVIRSAPKGIQRHLIRKAIASLRPGLRDVGFETVERALDFLSDEVSPAQTDLAAGLRLVLENDPANNQGSRQERLWLADWQAELPVGEWPQVGEDGYLLLPVPSKVHLPGDWVLTAEEVENLGEARLQAETNADPYRAWISLDTGLGVLGVRSRREGDRFKPLGMGGHSVKISDLMIDQKFPKRARLNWPLVLAGEEIAWVPGFRLGHPYRLTPESRRVVHLSLRRKKSDA